MKAEAFTDTDYNSMTATLTIKISEPDMLNSSFTNRLVDIVAEKIRKEIYTDILNRTMKDKKFQAMVKKKIYSLVTRGIKKELA